MGKGPNMLLSHEDDEGDLEAASSPLLPASKDSALSLRSSRPPSLYHQLKLDYISTIAVLFISVLWICGRVKLAPIQLQHFSNEADPHFPSRIGYAGPTPTGSEPEAAATAYPSYRDTSPLTPPADLKNQDFDILHHLGNLAPWRTVNHGLDTTAQVPASCELKQVQLLHRHGARYPTTGAGPAEFARDVVGKEGFRGTKDLAFLNNWKYKLGAEILTPFGREQLFALGVSFRTKYGHLLQAPSFPADVNVEGKKEDRKLVFRTETQDRMLKSALNFAAGFFGIPFESQYHQLVTIEWPHFNNTLAPYMTCINANRPDLNVGQAKMAEWLGIYLRDAQARLQKQVEGVDLSLRDVFNMQLMCAYELVALGGSEFCSLFTQDEWKGFEYAHDLEFYYSFSYGQPAQAAVGKGWVQEWLARVQGQPLTEFNSTTNASYHTPELFPLGNPIYVDATHDTIVSAVLTTLNFTSFAASGPLPSTHIPSNLSFRASSISPFSANLHSQIVSCGNDNGNGDEDLRVRWILNDGVVPLDGVRGCGRDKDGWCPLDTFVTSTRDNLRSIDWAHDCLSPYELGDEPILDGRPSRSRSRSAATKS